MMMMQERTDTILKDTVIGHQKGEDDHLVLTKEKEGALIMADGVVMLLHIKGKGPVLIMGEDEAQVLTREQDVVVVLSMVATATEAMRALKGGIELQTPGTVAVLTTRERG